MWRVGTPLVTTRGMRELANGWSSADCIADLVERRRTGESGNSVARAGRGPRVAGIPILIVD